MFDDTAGGFISAFESLAKAYVVAAVLWWLFLLFAWPFIGISRLIFFLFSCGRVRPGYRESLEHQGIVLLAFFIFIPSLFYIHIVYGANWYGNQS